MGDRKKAMTMQEAQALSDKELDRELKKKYGQLWNVVDLERDDPLAKEFLNRIDRATN